MRRDEEGKLAMILNTGSRTDIPAYFSDWFYNRISEGYVYTRNPYYPVQVQKYRLSPDVVDCLVFCTKNPKPMISRIQELSRFGQFWFVTITPYGKEIEAHVPDKEKVMDSFIKLSKLQGSQKMGWRYDPIFISEKYSLDYHIHTFEKMAEKLSGYTHMCVISFIDLYEKTKKNFPGVQQVTKEDRIAIGQAFVAIGKKYGIRIVGCAEGQELKEYGVDCTGCLTQKVIEEAIGITLSVPNRQKARETCDCLLGNDIGVYNTCGHGCIYCYANYNQQVVLENMRNHNPLSPFLVGEAMPDDIVKEVKQESYLDGQLRLF